MKATITYLNQNSQSEYGMCNFGAIIKIGKKSYAISFQSSKYYNGDEVSFSPKNLKFLELNVRPTDNMIFKTTMAIIRYKIDYKLL